MARKNAVFIATLASIAQSSSAFTTSTRHETGSPVRLDTKINTYRQIEWEESRDKRRCNPCPEPVSDDIDMDRREALFAAAGMMWATTTGMPSAAHAVYGADAQLELPNPLESMTKRVDQQCLVETLGNRECLVYLDPANKLYQGADSQVLLERLEKASEALATMPELIEAKKWTKVVGVMTGPMGSLGMIMEQLCKLDENSASSAALAKKVKTDLYAINSYVERKDPVKALENHEKATKDLVAFAKSL
mmetsp:Transcript_9169/g.10998  ORF Transcript_9169/g.10998 Transcript_9169/m.10998 type:complete len:249 (-) Transcript_9169:55-801(-)|eukprot:CAMPEP_0195303026 /NCGR_PEP_ID=MMETSP0707-20130614/32112_1 /TAXON_ID=33640 /ORGANISM="Asterionellopsis glacialis, Strain CCMP134" /LENGTH=248 /DNA_ID=CAMNT_0040366447 /DNA_START=44 /DNA_END=790 /DNA_ORIENTATION=-